MSGSSWVRGRGGVVEVGVGAGGGGGWVRRNAGITVGVVVLPA